MRNSGISRAFESLGTLVLAAGVTLPACRSEPPEKPRLRIGLLALLQGPGAETSGQPSVDAALLAAAVANEAGGIDVNGVVHEVEIIVRDHEPRADAAASAARALINQEKIHAIVGPQLSRLAIPVSVVAEEARVPMLSPMSSNPATTKDKEFVFRVAFLDDVQSKLMARFAVRELGATRAAILFDRATASGRMLSQAFAEAFESLGGSVVARESYARDEVVDYSEQLRAIKATDPEVFYLPNDGYRVVAQLKEARAVGITADLLGADTWDLTGFQDVPESHGAFIPHQWHPELDTEASRAFVDRYQQEYGEIPKVTAAMTFDAVRLILDAAEAQGAVRPESIRDGLAATGGFEGVTGAVSYLDSHDPLRNVVVSRLVDGGSELFSVVEPPPPC